MTTTVIDLLRHGEPEGGPMFRGNTDHPLSSRGWQQMETALAPGERWDVVLTSPLQRCRAFAGQVGSRLDVPVHSDDRLREISFGAWEGHTTEQVTRRWGEALQRFWNNPADHPPPQGEALADFRARVVEAWHHWNTRLAGQRVLLICHGGVIRMILAEVLEIPLQASFRVLAVPYAGRSRVRLDQTPHGAMACLISHGMSQNSPLEGQG